MAMAMAPKPAKRSCGTCRDRRVLCDRAMPACLQCSLSLRTCKGYGLRLSWPRADDGRRAVVLQPTLRPKLVHVGPIPHSRLVHMSSWDIRMHYHLTAPPPTAYPRPLLLMPIQYIPSPSESGDGDLLQYFHSTASQSLATFGQDSTNLGNVLLRIAMASETPSALAVLRGILAFSSLHRHGVHQQAMSLKIASLTALSAASKTDRGANELVQQVAAGMLLCSFEVHQSSCTSSQWTWYVVGAKELMSGPYFRKSSQDADVAALMDWVSYHDVLAQFTLRHWQGKSDRLPREVAQLAGAAGRSMKCSMTDESISYAMPFIPALPSRTRFSAELDGLTIRATPSTSAVLKLLWEICTKMPTRPCDTMSAQNLEEQRSLLRLCDWRIKNSPAAAETDETETTGIVVELYRLAILVYLHRISGNVLDQPARVQQQIDRAFTLFSQLASCERQFPIFILGCEARTEEQRAVMLDLISRTEEKAASRSFNHIRTLIPAVWAQDDLTGVELDYWDKLTSIISCCSIVPSLV